MFPDITPGWVLSLPQNVRQVWGLLVPDFFYKTNALPVTQPTVSKHLLSTTLTAAEI